MQVSLNEQSQITEARVIRSASGYFNNPALAATRSSKFAAEIKNCVPVAGAYAFIVRFVVGPYRRPKSALISSARGTVCLPAMANP